MKKMLSLAALFAALSYATPASAELKIGGDMSVRARAEVNADDPGNNTGDDLKLQYRLRLNGAADLGDGYFFKTMIMSENYAAAGYLDVNATGSENYALTASQIYFGRKTENCSYSVGRIPLNAMNNPIFDITLYPAQPLDCPVAWFNYDRLLGGNYSTKLGEGTLSTTLVVLDNSSTNVANGADLYNGLLNDGYAVDLAYTFTAGKVTIEPQVFAVLTNANVATAGAYAPTALATNVTPLTFGATVSAPVGSGKISGAAFYTSASEKNDAGAKTADYSGYLVRVKGESGPYMAWIDFNNTTNDNAAGAIVKDYTNTFVWAQYKYTAYKGAAGSLTLQPTLRYRASSTETAAGTEVDKSQLRGEFSATVTF